MYAGPATSYYALFGDTSYILYILERELQSSLSHHGISVIISCFGAGKQTGESTP